LSGIVSVGETTFSGHSETAFFVTPLLPGGALMSNQLTAIEVERMPAASVRQEIPDEHGLYLVVQPSGAKSWAFRYRDLAGRSRKLTLGPYPSVDLKQARKLALKAAAAVAEGRDPAGEKREAKVEAARAATDAFETLAERFIRERVSERSRPRTVREYARQLGFRVGDDGALIKSGAGVVADWRGRKTSEIKRTDVKRLVGGIRARGARVLANRTLATLSALFGWAVSEDIIEENPCIGVERPASEVSRERVLEDDELARIWKACDELGYPFGAAIKLMILTGQRRGEVAGMTWREANLESGTWSLPGVRTKNARAHNVPLSAAAVDVLVGAPRIKGDFVFTVDGNGPITSFARAKERLDAAIAEPALERWTLHDLRRTVATGLQRLGIRLEVTESVLNHVSGTRGGIAGVYQRHDWAEEKAHALGGWADHVERIVAGAPVATVVPMLGRRR
jgi:integrase